VFVELVLKELRDHLLSLRFQVGLLLALVLVSVSAFVLSAQYSRENRDFFARHQQLEDFLGKYAHLNRVGGLIRPSRPPSPLVLVRGLPNDAGTETLEENPMPNLFPPVDLASVVAIVFSLLSIVLGFDAINSEKERGTLRLVLVSRLRRFEILAAKWTGGALVLVVALLAAWLAGMAIVLVQSGTHWSRDDALSLLAVWAVSLLYCGSFFTLALAFSAIFTRSSVSVLTSLFAWVLLVFVIPNISPYLAAQVVRVPSIAALQRDLQYVTSEERDNLGREGSSRAVEKLGCVWLSTHSMECPAGSGGRQGATGKVTLEFQDLDQPSEALKRRIEGDPAFRRFYEQLRKEIESVWTEVNRRQSEKAERMEEAWRSRAQGQFRLSKGLSCASPLPPFIYASTELSLTGFATREQFEQQAGAYERAFGDYLWARYHAEQAKNPAFSVDDFLNMSTRPRFTYVPPRFSERLAEILPFAGMLAGWTLASFVVSVVGFLRFDVR